MRSTRLTLAGNTLQLFCSYEERERAKQVAGYRWNGRLKCWEYPLGYYDEVRRAFPHAVVSEDLQERILSDKALEKEVSSDKLAGWENVEPTEPMPIKTKPFRHQVLGYELACKILGIFGKEGE